MNYEFLEAQIKEAKESIKHFARGAIVAKTISEIDGVDKEYEERQIKLYEAMITEKEDLLDIFYTARDLSKKL
jgi:hypothetical protein